MDNEWMIKWFKLCNVKGLGPRKIIKLFDYFDSLDRVWTASNDELLRSRIFKESMIPYWEKLKEASSENFEKILTECKQNDISIVPITSEDFPLRLKVIPNPPVHLFLQGHTELLQTKKVAIVGSRQSDEKSKKWAFTQSADLAKQGVTVVSGGAVGVDYEAHRGALEASGKTICVMGPGLLKLFPEKHLDLFYEIKKKGLLISENLPSFPGSRIALLQRNRITSGLSDALIAVTGTSGHGVMTQLRHAYEQKIPIFCPKLNFKFTPIDGIKEVKQEYKITEIESINPVLKVVEHNNLSYLASKQVTLF